MKYWLLGLACVACALVLLIARHAAPLLVRPGLFATYAISGALSLRTAFAYGQRDRLRWAWLTFGAAWIVALGGKLLVGDSADFQTMAEGRAWAWAATIVGLNVLSVTALALFARVWSGTGLAPPWRPYATIAFVALALAINGHTLAQSTREMLTIKPTAFGVFASVAGDVIGIALVGPIFATAIALRGGVLMRPWLFLFASSLCWIFDDMTLFMSHAAARDIDIVARSLAVLLVGAAALAQLWVKREVAAGFVEE